MEFNGGTLTIPTGSVALPSAYDPGATSFTNGTLVARQRREHRHVEHDRRNQAGRRHAHGHGRSHDRELHLRGRHDAPRRHDHRDRGLGLSSGATLDLDAATTLNAGAGLAVSGTLNVTNGGSLDIAANSVNIYDFGGGALHIASGGTLVRSVAGVDGQLTLPVTSQGTVHAQAGLLAFNVGTGLTQTAGMTTVDATLSGAVHLQGGTLDGTGTLGGPVDNSGGTVAPGRPLAR